MTNILPIQKVVILDRDGVINQDSDAFVKSPAEWQPIPGSLEAIAQLNQAGYRVVIATNQSGIGRGYFNPDTLQQMHHKMHTLLAGVSGTIDNIYVCPHTPNDQCNCRKPKTGLFQQIDENYNVDLTKTFNIGDSLRDIEAGHTMGCRNILVLTGKGQSTYTQHPDIKNIVWDIATDLAAAVEKITGQKASPTTYTKNSQTDLQ